MGILTLTFYAYTRPNGKIIVEMCVQFMLFDGSF
jgi:hypothetical protein